MSISVEMVVNSVEVIAATAVNEVEVSYVGIQGQRGIQGVPAPALNIQYSADGNTWSDSYTAGDFYARFSTDGGSTWGAGLLIRGEQGIQGDEGPQGDTGPQGKGLTILGTLASTDDLPADPDVGDGYIIGVDLYTYTPTGWVYAGQIQGPQGIQGPEGPQGPAGTPAPALEIEYSADDVLWSTTYTAGDYYARFSVDGGSTWGAGLMFRGPQGIQGPAGTDGIDGLDGADGRTILSGTVDPTTEGVDGDFYLNTATSTLFGPKATTWPDGVSLIGPAGTGIPTISSGDSGKVLAVKSDESGVEWSNGYVPTSLTTITPTASSIPIADSGGKIADGWIPATVARTASPTFTGTPAAPTAPSGTSTVQIATTEFVKTAVDVVSDYCLLEGDPA